VDSALTHLLDIGALRRDGDDVALTSLGYYLALLPLDVGLGKALILAAILRYARGEVPMRLGDAV
jgi:HrpA-like RNA helicase